MQLKMMGWLILALICGITSSIVVRKVFWSGSKNVPIVEEAKGPSSKVLVAKYDIPLGSEFTAQNIRFDVIQESIVPRDAIYTTDGILGRKASVNVPKNSILTLFDITMQQKKNTEDNPFVPPGYSVVPIKIESVTLGEGGSDLSGSLRLDDILQKTDRINLSVIQSVRSNGPKEGTNTLPKLVVRPLAQNVIVYKIMSELRLGINSTSPQRVTIVSVLLDDKNVKILREAANSGRIHLSIVGKKNETMEGKQIAGDLLGTSLESVQKPSLPTFKEEPSNVSVKRPTSSHDSQSNDNFCFGISLNGAASKEKMESSPLKEIAKEDKSAIQNLTSEKTEDSKIEGINFEGNKKEINEVERTVELPVPKSSNIEPRKITLQATPNFADFKPVFQKLNQEVGQNESKDGITNDSITKEGITKPSIKTLPKPESNAPVSTGFSGYTAVSSSTPLTKSDSSVLPTLDSQITVRVP